MHDWALTRTYRSHAGKVRWDVLGLIPGARLRTIEGAGHLVQEGAPAELTAALAGFLS